MVVRGWIGAAVKGGVDVGKGGEEKSSRGRLESGCYILQWPVSRGGGDFGALLLS